jgi:hypothetical protein
MLSNLQILLIKAEKSVSATDISEILFFIAGITRG